MTRVLVIAAHPDDEVLGCGATMARHAARGDEVSVLVLADGVGARNAAGSSENASELQQRQRAANEANAILGTGALALHDFPDNQMDAVPLLAVVKRVEAELTRAAPDIIYTHYAYDLNIDHCLTHRAVITAARPSAFPSVRLIACFEIASSTEWMPAGSGVAFAPNYFVDITGFLDCKLRALACYDAEMRPYPHPRSEAAIRHQAAMRGCMAHLEAAEAFVISRMIEGD